MKLIRLASMTLSEIDYKITAEGKVSEGFGVNRGLRRGDPLSTTLFIILEKAIRESGLWRNETIDNNKNQCVAYSDDIQRKTED